MMLLKRVKLENIRGISSLDIKFPKGTGDKPGWTVLAGRNGTGKTTLLQAIAATIIGPSNFVTMTARPDLLIRAGKEKGRSVVWVDASDDDVLGDSGVMGSHKVVVAWSRSAGESVRRSERSAFIDRNLWTFNHSSKQGWFFAAYGLNRFSANSQPQTPLERHSPARRTAVQTLFGRDRDLTDAALWAGQLGSAGKALFGPDPSKAPVVALRSLLSDLLTDQNDPGEIEYRRDGIWLRRNEGLISISDLGQGYESLLLLVTDIVRHMARFYGDAFQASEDSDGKTILQHSGVVLIDEMENHLHPQLQQRVGPWFKTHFPNLQFIVTTHSPFVCQAADEGGLFRVANPGTIELVSDEVFRRVVNGSADDAVLTDLFGLKYPYSQHSRNIREKLAAIESRILSGERLTNPEEERRRHLIDELPNDPGTEIRRVLDALVTKP